MFMHRSHPQSSFNWFFQVSRIADSEKSVMLMLGRCLPHIVPNVLLAKREVRHIKLFSSQQSHHVVHFCHFEVQCYIFILLSLLLAIIFLLLCMRLCSQRMVLHLCQVSSVKLHGIHGFQFCLQHYYQLSQCYYCRSIQVS